MPDPTIPTPPTPGARFDALVRLMETLRSPGGCPWDREQTLESLRPFLLEETYEALDAIDRNDRPGLCEELGDLVFEAVFLARICEEDGDFSIGDAIQAIADKLVRRHPHVFGNARPAETAREVEGRWEAIKRGESNGDGATKTTLGGVPRTLPALLRAHEYGTRAAAVGFDWERPGDVVHKIREEIDEVAHVLGVGAGGVPGVDAARLEDEVGDLLFALANLARKLGVEPESALRKANDKFARRFGELERRFTARGESLASAGLDRLEAEWQDVKRQT